jgi:hypothetical protein
MKQLFILLFILVASLCVGSCGTVPKVTEGKIHVQDTEKNDYIIAYKDNNETKVFKALVDVKGKTYTCEVDYTEAAPDAMGMSLDISAAELTGAVKFTYKAITVECSVYNEELSEADKKEIDEATKADSLIPE